MKKKHEYLFVLRSSLRGTYVSSWHEITEDEQETKGVVFGMTISSTMNMGSGVLKVMADEEWTPELLENHIRSMSQEQLNAFIKESSLAS